MDHIIHGIQSHSTYVVLTILWFWPPPPPPPPHTHQKKTKKKKKPKNKQTCIWVGKSANLPSTCVLGVLSTVFNRKEMAVPSCLLGQQYSLRRLLAFSWKTKTRQFRIASDILNWFVMFYHSLGKLNRQQTNIFTIFSKKTIFDILFACNFTYFLAKKI